MIKFFFTILTGIFFSASAQAPLDIRIALVIGNAAYTQVTRLDNTGNDARSIAHALRRLGFVVVELHDANKSQMADALEKVRVGLKGYQGLGMLYYAGHGLQLDWHNYILPIDIRLTKAVDLPRQALDVADIVNLFKAAGTRMNIVVLDACRDNPFAKSGLATKGLANMDAPPGTLLAYATQPGNVAEDGDQDSLNGPYAQFLQVELLRPFARVEDVFKRVRFQVRQRTAGRQVPWESTSLEEDFMFNDGQHDVSSSQELDRMAAEAKRREQALMQQANQAREREQQLAAAIEMERLAQLAAARQAEQKRQDDIAEMAVVQKLAAQEREKEQQRLISEARRREQERLVQETQAREREQKLATERARELAHQLALAQALAQEREIQSRQKQQAEQLEAEAMARERFRLLSAEKQREQLFAAEKVDWDRIRDAKASAEIYAYLHKYPNGSITELAQAKLEKINKPVIQPTPDRTGLVQPFEAKRFVLGDSYQFIVRDLLTKLEVERPVFNVIKADEETVEFNQGYKVTQAGAIIRTIAGATLDPYQQWIPSGEYQVGKKWHTRSIMTLKEGKSLWVELEGRVVARETITVPAGSFDTYKMEMEQIAQDGTRLKITYWGQPDWGVAVRQIREIRDNRGNASGQIYELVSRKRVGI